MQWALIRDSDNAWLQGPLDAEPTPGQGEHAIVVALGYPDSVAWSPEKGGFVDIVTVQPMITVGRFKLLFTYNERVALRTAATSNRQVEDFLDLLAGFTDGVSLSDPVLITSVNALVPLGLLTQVRADAILSGTPPA